MNYFGLGIMLWAAHAAVMLPLGLLDGAFRLALAIVGGVLIITLTAATIFAANQ